MTFARQEREDLVAFLATLSEQQWSEPTLCTGWSVRDLVAHVVSYDELDGRGLVRRFVAGRFIPSRINAIGVAEYAKRSPRELLEVLTEHVEPRGFTTGFGGMIALIDGMVHHQDIRRALGMPRDIPPERLLRTLRLALLAPPLGAFWRARGLRLVASDQDWASGRGPEVCGQAEAILMAVAGRRGVVEELSGPGQRKLADRINGGA
ncbi:maleylpyruvate isomerase family mycothiol-dependent enzyme [Saccharopolyspora shandongensis]|uniref:maleylpyruvate isomerase family mycothiol-dependent enzyme n=1 Tax=Saccharopolyspora shandongensis TaxID=418495 RepID=UPI0033CE2280